MALGSSLKKKETRPASPQVRGGTRQTGLLITAFFFSALQYRDTTRAQLFHRLLSEHKALVDEHEKTQADLRKTGTSFFLHSDLTDLSYFLCSKQQRQMLSLRSKWTGCFQLKVHTLPSHSPLPLFCCADLYFPFCYRGLGGPEGHACIMCDLQINGDSAEGARRSASDSPSV